MKDIDSIKFEDLTLEENRIIIKNKPHKLSDKINVLFFKNIDCKSYNDTFLGLPAYKKDNLYIISLSRNKALQIIEDLYKYNEKREAVITHFFNQKLDKRHLIITKEELAWETEVWIAEMPEHMIHLNGDRFMGPREKD